MKNLVVITGAGMSAESGLQTFRDAGGLWEGYNVMDVASPKGFYDNPELVLQFYNERRRQLLKSEPNMGHALLAEMEAMVSTRIITQNVDDLHERAGSTNVLHLHGELRKARCTIEPGLIYDWDEDLSLNNFCENGHRLRPHIVWFGEEVPALSSAIPILLEADFLLIIGSSLQVYPAAGLIGYAPKGIPVFYIDPNPQINYELSRSNNLTIYKETASEGLKRFREKLRSIIS